MIISLCFRVMAQVPGCTDPLATNYNAGATANDGSCVYAVTTVSTSSVVLDNSMSETSGLLRLNNFLWTHNDNGDVNLYAIDTTNGSVAQTCMLTNVTNIDWEEIQQDDNFIYIGDFGNNQNGDRTDLRILRIDKLNFCSNALVDTIAFAYEDQTDFTPTGNENTDFDCEAFIVSDDSIFLFTKQWNALQTTVYALPKTTGSFIAKKKNTYNVNGLVTGAAYLKDNGLVALCGYSSLLQPFVFLLYDFNNDEFFSGNKRRLELSLPFHQVESIASNDGKIFQLTNEAFSPVSVAAKFHVLDLQPYTENYLGATQLVIENSLAFFPNPAQNILTIEAANNITGQRCAIIDATGRVVKTENLTSTRFNIYIGSLTAGIYILRIGEQRVRFMKY